MQARFRAECRGQPIGNGDGASLAFAADAILEKHFPHGIDRVRDRQLHGELGRRNVQARIAVGGWSEQCDGGFRIGREVDVEQSRAVQAGFVDHVQGVDAR